MHCDVVQKRLDALLSSENNELCRSLVARQQAQTLTEDEAIEWLTSPYEADNVWTYSISGSTLLGALRLNLEIMLYAEASKIGS